MTGFGAAIGKLIDQKIISNFDEVKDSIIPNLKSNNFNDGLEMLIQKLDEIRIKAKKIGNAQRFSSHLLFKTSLFKTFRRIFGY